MTDYTVLGDAIKTTIRDDAWLGNPENVKSVEINKRGFSIQDQQNAMFFSAADTPAVAIVANAEEKRQSLETTNEIRELIPCEIAVVTRNRSAQDGWAAHQTLVSNIESLMESQVTSQKDLGIDALVQSVSTRDEQFKDGSFYYFISVITVQVDLTATFEEAVDTGTLWTQETGFWKSKPGFLTNPG